MRGDLIIKDVDLDKLEEDLEALGYVYEKFEGGDTSYSSTVDAAGVRVLGMLKTWAEGRKAEKEDEELVRKLTSEVGTKYAYPASFEEVVRTGIEMAVKAQRKRLGK